ncbi:Integrin beta-4 [Armadillidium vulgare]|nr:Integrin beta-4 [Armadillidium vulgare]
MLYSFQEDFDQYELANQNNRSILYPEINITALSACSLYVTWDCLLCKEKFVEKYTLNWSPANFENDTVRRDVGNDSLYYIINDLLADTEYMVSVSSHISGKVFESIPEIEPSEVTGLTCTKKTSSKIYLEWDETKNECPIKGYRIEYSGTVLWKESTRAGQESSKINSAVLTNLVPFTNYTIFVSKVYSEDEEGPFALLPDIYTEEDVAESPEPITSYAINSTSIEVNWTEPLVKNGIITAYELSWQLQRGGEDDEPQVLITTDFTLKVE